MFNILKICFVISLLFLESCDSNKSQTFTDNKLDQNDSLSRLLKRSDSIGLTRIDKKEKKESIRRIERKYGEQWDFCDCVRKGDSVNKALKVGNLSDKKLDQLMCRFDEIDKKCQAFKIMDPHRTPEDRELHEKKVRDCLNNR